MSSAYQRRSDRLKYCRETSLFSDKEQATALDVSVSTLYRWEDRDHVLKNVDKIIEIAKYHNKSAVWLAWNYGLESHTFNDGFDEARLIGRYRELSDDNKRLVFDLILAVLDKP